MVFLSIHTEMFRHMQGLLFGIIRYLCSVLLLLFTLFLWLFIGYMISLTIIFSLVHLGHVAVLAYYKAVGVFMYIRYK